MKSLSTSIIVLLSFILSATSYAQNNLAANETKKQLNEQIALKNFGFDNFNKEVSSYYKLKGYNYDEDKCLQNFLESFQINLFHDVFLSYQKNTPLANYKTIYKNHIQKYKSALDLFIKEENTLRKEWARRIESSAPALK